MNAPTLAISPLEGTHRKTNPGIVTEAHTDPAWSEIAIALGEDDGDGDAAEVRAKVAAVLRATLAFITAPADARQGDWQSLCGRRAVALMLQLDADAFGKSVSAARLAKELGVCEVNLCRLGIKAEKAFGLKPATTKGNL